MQIGEQALWAIGALLCCVWLFVVIAHDIKLCQRLIKLKVMEDEQVKWFHFILEWSVALPILGLALYCTYRMVEIDFVKAVT